MKNMPRRRLLTGLLAFTLVFAACKKNDETIITPVSPILTQEQLYAHAVTDAMYADSSEISQTLWPVTRDNPDMEWKTINGQEYVLMATFMKFPASYPQGDSITNVWGESWVFTPKQMKSRIGPGFKPGSDTVGRICQLLGLPPAGAGSNTHIAEVWVKASSLYRPAGNNNITTRTTGAILQGSDSTYNAWFNNYIIYAYYRPLSGSGMHYPWTRLGYTYDWAPGANEMGLSEFVIRPKSGLWVERTRRAADFFR
ncbi:hypothetical protein ECE50_013725 [Chitinophaga sp. Mgbs1]|uniref:Uncharacterized protein n=1 Tax=Chitinophaga solisilvae TaxID=1233460 RepID=A0A3S1DPP4_9BACT|nr:hypothetical protein [Chitinophaga solisilvae]